MTETPATRRAAPAELMVVGDADQSIYAFRGANIRNILDFEEDFPDATHDPARAELPLDPDHPVGRERRHRAATRAARPRTSGPTPATASPSSATSPTTSTTRRSSSPTRSTGSPTTTACQPGDVAVFYRTNAQSRVFEEVFIRVGLPYKVVGGVRFYERREVRDALAYLRVLVNPADTVSLRRILNVPKRGIGDRAEACVEALAQRERLTFWEALRSADEAPGIATRSLKRVAAFVAMIDGAADAWSTSGARPDDVLEAVLDAVRLPRGARASRPTRRTRPASRTSTSSSRVAARVRRRARPDGDARDFLERVALVADADQIPDEDEPAGVVTLMTLHTAKGLEFPVVFLTGLEDGVFPHCASLGDPTRARGGAAARLRRDHPGPAAALRLTRGRPVARGARRSTTRRRASSRSCPTSWSTGGAPRPPRRLGELVGVEPVRRPGRLHPRVADTMRAAAPDARRRSRPPAPGRCPRSSPATGSCTTPSAWARWSPSRASPTRRSPSIDFGSDRRQAPPAALLPRRKALTHSTEIQTRAVHQSTGPTGRQRWTTRVRTSPDPQPDTRSPPKHRPDRPPTVDNTCPDQLPVSQSGLGRERREPPFSPSGRRSSWPLGTGFLAARRPILGVWAQVQKTAMAMLADGEQHDAHEQARRHDSLRRLIQQRRRRPGRSRA